MSVTGPDPKPPNPGPMTVTSAAAPGTPLWALAAAAEVVDEQRRAGALGALLPVLPDTSLEPAMACVRGIADRASRLRATVALAGRLGRAGASQDAVSGLSLSVILEDALRIAAEVPDGQLRGALLAALSQLAPNDFPARAVDCVTAIDDAYERARGLGALASGLSGARRDAVLEAALLSVATLTSSNLRTCALKELSTGLPAELAGRALSIAATIKNDAHRAERVAALVPLLRDNLLEWALDIAETVGDVRDRAPAVAALARRLPARRAADLMARSLASAKAIPDDYDQARALVLLAPAVPAELIEQALAVVAALPGEFNRDWVLEALVERLPDKLLHQAVAIAGAIRGPQAEGRALAALVPRLPEVLLDRALTAVFATQGRGLGRSLAVLAPRLSEVQREQALAAAAGLPDGYPRAWAVAALAPVLPNRLQARALTLVSAIAEQGARAHGLQELARYLPDQLLPEALGAAETLHGPGRGTALAAFAPRIDAARWQRALRLELLAALASFTAIDPELGYDCLSGLARDLPVELLEEALALAEVIADDHARALAVAALVPVLPLELLPAAVCAAGTITKTEDRDLAMATLIGRVASAWHDATTPEGEPDPKA